MGRVRNLDLKALLSACVHLSRRAGGVIREVHREGQLGAHNKKAEGDKTAAEAMDPAAVLTIADTRAQNLIVKNVRAMFPGIRLVGEEDESTAIPEEAPSISLDEVPPLKNDFEVPEDLAKSLTLADTCLWIDPLDGTIEFVRNNVHHVCVLIGVAVKDRPVAGVVLEPFNGNEDGIVTYGAVGVGVFGDQIPAFASPPKSFAVGMEEKHAKIPRLAAAAKRLSSSGPTVSQGAGQNLLKVLRGHTSVFIQDAGASRWDTCAAEALLMAVGGKVTDLKGRPYLYKQDAASYINSEGLIAARAGYLHDQSVQALAQIEPAPSGATEMRVTLKRSSRFYASSACSFLRGVQAQPAEGEKEAQDSKPAVEHLRISGLGEASVVAIATATQVVSEGAGSIERIQTAYPSMGSGHGCAQVIIDLKKK